MKTSIYHLIDFLGLNFGFIGKVFYDTFKADSSLMSQEAKEILSNEEDRKKFEEAIENLKKDTTVRSKEIKLSNNRKIKISIS
ncbi:hypothetical protein [Elizabethkingia meningoseptica]|uniref:hypothetical protein n=1 Tax=Elizabethkingia meningoseptica TaxID=238 RepID=UPI003892BEE2